MTRLEKPFWQAMKAGLLHPGDKASVQLLSDAASDWEKDGKYFSAAYAMGQAISAAWGDGQLIRSCIRRALTDYRKCVEANPPDSYESLVALLKWSEALYFPLQSSDRSQWEGLWNELAQRLFNYFKDSPHVDSYLVRGVLLKTDLEGDWESEFPEFEVAMGVSGLNRFEGFVTLNLPSAFRLFIYAGDYQGARAVIERCPQAFTTPWSQRMESGRIGSGGPDTGARAICGSF